MAIILPTRTKTTVSSVTVREDPGFVRRQGRQQIAAIRAKSGVTKQALGVVDNIQREAHESRIAQETAEFDADYNTLMTSELRRQLQSGDLDTYENAGKLTGEFHDKITSKALAQGGR